MVETHERNMADLIEIHGLRAHGLIGLHDWERKQTQDVLVSVRMYLDLAPAGASDRIEDTIDYGAVSRGIQELVARESKFTIEALATEAAGWIFRTFPRIDRLWIRMEKPTVDQYARIAAEIERHRSDLV